MEFTKTLRAVAEHKLEVARTNKVHQTEMIVSGNDPHGILLMECALLRIQIESLEKWLADGRADFSE